jgi:phage shock protein A
MTNPNKAETQQIQNCIKALDRLEKSLASLVVKMELNGRNRNIKHACAHARELVDKAQRIMTEAVGKVI